MMPIPPLSKLSRLAALLGATLAIVPCAHAQLDVRIQAAKGEIVAYEQAKVEVTITNRSTLPILLARHQGADDPWLGFEVVREGVEVIQPVGRLVGLVPQQLRAGQTIVRNIDLALIYPMNRFGRYTIRAQVWTPPDSAWTLSDATRINVVDARTIWSTAFGVPLDRPGGGSSRIYKVLRYQSVTKRILYLRLEDRRTGRVLACYPVGEVIESREPSFAVDGQARLHLLYLNTPDITLHTVIDASGKVVSTDQYRDSRRQRPVLSSTPSGEVVVLGAKRHDPAAEAAARLTVHRVSEIPGPVAALLRAAPAGPVTPLPDGEAPGP